jgi:hypothetical protein
MNGASDLLIEVFGDAGPGTPARPSACSSSTTAWPSKSKASSRSRAETEWLTPRSTDGRSHPGGATPRHPASTAATRLACPQFSPRVGVRLSASHRRAGLLVDADGTQDITEPPRGAADADRAYPPGRGATASPAIGRRRSWRGSATHSCSRGSPSARRDGPGRREASHGQDARPARLLSLRSPAMGLGRDDSGRQRQNDGALPASRPLGHLRTATALAAWPAPRPSASRPWVATEHPTFAPAGRRQSASSGFTACGPVPELPGQLDVGCVKELVPLVLVLAAALRDRRAQLVDGAPLPRGRHLPADPRQPGRPTTRRSPAFGLPPCAPSAPSARWRALNGSAGAAGSGSCSSVSVRPIRRCGGESRRLPAARHP